MGEMLLEQLNEIAKTEGLFETVGKMYKKMFDGLVAAGFTEGQAMTIIVAHGLSVKMS